MTLIVPVLVRTATPDPMTTLPLPGATAARDNVASGFAEPRSAPALKRYDHAGPVKGSSVPLFEIPSETVFAMSRLPAARRVSSPGNPLGRNVDKSQGAAHRHITGAAQFHSRFHAERGIRDLAEPGAHGARDGGKIREILRDLPLHGRIHAAHITINVQYACENAACADDGSAKLGDCDVVSAGGRPEYYLPAGSRASGADDAAAQCAETSTLGIELHRTAAAAGSEGIHANDTGRTQGQIALLR